MVCRMQWGQCEVSALAVENLNFLLSALALTSGRRGAGWGKVSKEAGLSECRRCLFANTVL